MNGFCFSATNRDLNVGARSNDNWLRSYLQRVEYYGKYFAGGKESHDFCQSILSQMLRNIIIFFFVRIKKIFPVALVLFPLHLSKIFNDLTRLSIIAENSMSIFSIQDTYKRRHAWKYVEKELEDRVKPSLISVIEQNLETTWLARSATSGV